VTDGNGDGEEHSDKSVPDRDGTIWRPALVWMSRIIKTRLLIEKIIENIRAMRRTAGRDAHAESRLHHGPLGNYGHPHHQDVSRAVHKMFCESVRSTVPLTILIGFRLQAHEKQFA
jgi:hypothetical protein